MRKTHIESGHLKQARRNATMLNLLRAKHAATPSIVHIIIHLISEFVNNIL